MSLVMIDTEALDLLTKKLDAIEQKITHSSQDPEEL